MYSVRYTVFIVIHQLQIEILNYPRFFFNFYDKYDSIFYLTLHYSSHNQVLAKLSESFHHEQI